MVKNPVYEVILLKTTLTDDQPKAFHWKTWTMLFQVLTESTPRIAWSIISSQKKISVPSTPTSAAAKIAGGDLLIRRTV